MSRLPTNLRLLRILEAVADAGDALSPTQINARVDLPKQSIHRLCQTLVEEGYLIRDVSGRRLRPAPRSITMARGLIASRHATIARRQILLRLSAATSETVNFAVPEDDGMTYLDRVETDWAFRIELPIGSRVPFHCTASGKCFLASLDPRQRRRMLASIRFEPRTPNTLMTSADVAAEIDKVAVRGYAIDNQELFEGMVALAVPVQDAKGRYSASVAFHGPTQRLAHSTLVGHLEVMKEGARELGALLD